MHLGGEEITMSKTNKCKYFFLLLGKVVSGSYCEYLICQGPRGTAVYGGVTLKPHKTQAAEQIIKQRTRKKEQAEATDHRLFHLNTVQNISHDKCNNIVL